MLSLKNITKDYEVGDGKVEALRGIDIEFRRNEFVSILGQSGCGKTTLLNIIGGLDQYSAGDLSINGKSTKDFKDRDWDAYRNHSVGFVFQSYNLIPHQTVLSNVELALTLSGVSKSERRRRAIEALTKVGLADQIKKKPNQMSGGQMQRVAIARALVNDPEILLADEPTGALDSETSVQVMEILKEVARDRLVIMVTHNPELAERYSTRIVRLLDGRIIDDSDPYDGKTEVIEPVRTQSSAPVGRKKRPSMSFFTALSLSLNNLMTKKGRTFLTAFAGSIGIIGIALILSISSGMQNYIDRVQEDTLSSYPITIEDQTMDLTSMMTSLMGEQPEQQVHEPDRVYAVEVMNGMLEMMANEIKTNNLELFKAYLEDPANGFDELLNGIQYGYETPLNIYKSDTSDGIEQINPSTLLEQLGFGQMVEMQESSGMSSMSGQDVWQEILDNEELLDAQYEVIAGRMPAAMDEVVLVVDENNEVTDYALYSLGLLDADELEETMQAIMNGQQVDTGSGETISYTYDELLQLTFKCVPETDYYVRGDNGVWVDMRTDEAYMQQLLEQAMDIRVVGILRPREDAVATAISGTVGYTPELMQYLIEQVNASEIVQQQQANPEINVLTGLPFEEGTEQAAAFDPSLLPAEQQQYYATLSPEEQAAFAAQYSAQASGSAPASYADVLAALGVADPDNPSSISMYAKDFASKELLTDAIETYNREMENAGTPENAITYTDFVGLMMSSVSTIIDAISYVLIAFVAISLIVSSIMIGIITYISVLERTKEIGVLRSIGASKRDISRVFNAETLIIGLTSGLIGILITLLLTIPVNAIINSFAEIGTVAALPVAAGVILVLISMALTMIAGLIPARLAAKKDPVVALRTE